MSGESVSYVVAFVAGLLTFFSPCLLPLIPSYVVYITGMSFTDLKDDAKRGEVRKKAAAHSLLFILGFSTVFIILGLSATVLGGLMLKYQNQIRILGGALIIIFGLHLTGVLKLDMLAKEKKFRLPAKGAGYLGSLLVGVTFAAAWTPCAGPILGSILVIAGTKAKAAEGLGLLSMYSAGIAVPFFLSSLAVNSFLEYFDRFKKLISVINIIGGIFLIIVGILVMTGYLSVITMRLFNAFSK